MTAQVLELTLLTRAAHRVNLKHREVERLGRTAKDIAAEIGEELLAVKGNKKMVPHGQFKPWIEENCSFSYTKAREYMQVAKTKLTDLRHFEQADSIIAVLSLNREPKQEKRSATLDDLRKVESLRALRDDPTTTDGERAAAQAKLNKIEAELGPVDLEKQQECKNVEGRRPRAENLGWRTRAWAIDRVTHSLRCKLKKEDTEQEQLERILKRLVRRAYKKEDAALWKLMEEIEKL